MQVKKQQLEPDMKQHTGSKLGKEYIPRSDDRSSLVYGIYGCLQQGPEGGAWTIEEGTRLPHVTQAVLCPMSQPKVKGETSQRAAQDSETEDGS